MSNQKHNDRLLLIDASHMSHRAYHTRELCTTTGIDTSVLHGLIDMVQLLCERFRTGNFLLVWDSNKPTFRHQLFPDYKKRAFTDDPVKREERLRIANSKKIAGKALRNLNVPMTGIPGWECDDIIGMIANNVPDDLGINHVVIVSDDKDFYQLCEGTRVVVWRPIKDELVTEQWMRDQYNLSPSQWVDFKALIGEGETQDNIPGIDGIGEKTAMQLLWDHTDLEGIHNWLQQQLAEPKCKKSIKKWAAQFEAGKASLAYGLSKIVTDMATLDGNDRCKLLTHIIGACQPKSLRLHDVVDFKGEYEFGSLNTDRFAQACRYEVVAG